MRLEKKHAEENESADKIKEEMETENQEKRRRDSKNRKQEKKKKKKKKKKKEHVTRTIDIVDMNYIVDVDDVGRSSKRRKSQERMGLWQRQVLQSRAPKNSQSNFIQDRVQAFVIWQRRHVSMQALQDVTVIHQLPTFFCSNKAKSLHRSTYCALQQSRT